jgi:hypothetical protein
MEHEHPGILGALTGNRHQPQGKHRENAMDKGIGFIPVGDRDRCKPEYGIVELVERDNNDPNVRFK